MQTKYSKLLDTLNISEFIAYYSNHNIVDTSKHFNMNTSLVTRLCKDIGFKKDKSLVANQIKQTKVLRYGSIAQLNAHNKAKRDQSLIARYGSIEEAKLAISEKCKLTNSKKENSFIYLINHIDKQKFIDLYINQNKSRTYIMHEYNITSYMLDKIIDYFDCHKSKHQSSYIGLNTKYSKYGTRDNYLEFNDLLLENNIKFTREFPISNKSFDFKIDDILIEINPTATHNSIIGIRGNSSLPMNYHKLKSQLARDNGYRCIHIWDWDDKDKIINSLMDKKVIYARKCVIKEISKYEIDEFLNLYHFQNTCKNQAIRLGLFYNDALIQVMSFGKPRYNKKYEFELLRLCTKAEYKIIGGAEKLFKHFIDNYNPESIISYCDLSKFNGNVYYKLGFSLKSEGTPTCHWYNMRTHQHILDSSLRAKGFDILLGKQYGCFGKGTSNEQLMLDHDFVKVYDCGQAQFIWLK